MHFVAYSTLLVVCTNSTCQLFLGCVAEPGGDKPPPGYLKTVSGHAGARARAGEGVSAPFLLQGIERERERERGASNMLKR